MRKIYLNLCLLVFGTLISFSASAQQVVQMPGVVSQLTLDEQGRIKCEMHTHDEVAEVHHSFKSTEGSKVQNTQKANNSAKKGKNSGGAVINVSYFNFDPNISQEELDMAVIAFQSAVDIWSQSIESEVPINVAAVLQPLGEGVLGSAGPTSIFANAPGLERNTWYGNALADKLVGEDLTPGNFDIIARFSTVFPNWYYGTDGETPEGDFDFRTVVFHELCHGLGFFGSMFVDNATGVGDWGFGIEDPVYPAIYDRLALDRPGKQLIKKYDNFSTELGDVLLDDPLVFRGPRIVKATKGKGARIFTVVDSEIFGEIEDFTDIWLPGSSYSHLDFVTYAGGDNGLMVPFLSRGLSYDEPGEIVKAIFDDIGWNGKVNRPFVDPSVLADNGDDDDDLSLFPNEVKDRFLVKLEGGKFTSATIKDLQGQSYDFVLSKDKGKMLNFDLSASKMKAGMYILQLNYKDRGPATLRVVKTQ